MSDGNPKQWQLDNARHLKGQRLQFRRYERWSESWDHDHCAACWATFAEWDGTDVQHEGYATRDDYRLGACYDWVCKSCYEELKDELGWAEESGPGLGSPNVG